MIALDFHPLAGQICNVGDIINNTGIIKIFGEGNTVSQLEGKSYTSITST